MKNYIKESTESRSEVALEIAKVRILNRDDIRLSGIIF